MPFETVRCQHCRRQLPDVMENRGTYIGALMGPRERSVGSMFPWPSVATVGVAAIVGAVAAFLGGGLLGIAGAISGALAVEAASGDVCEACKADQIRGPAVRTDWGGCRQRRASRPIRGPAEALEGVWAHSRGGSVTIRREGSCFTIANPHSEDVTVAAERLLQPNGLHYYGHTGALEGGAITWSNGSVWTKLAGVDPAASDAAGLGAGAARPGTAQPRDFVRGRVRDVMFGPASRIAAAAAALCWPRAPRCPARRPPPPPKLEAPLNGPAAPLSDPYVPPPALKHLLGENLCSICLEELRGSAVTITACGHVFHERCLRLADGPQCPQCRQSR